MKFLEWLVFLLPRKRALSLGRFLGGCAYYVFKKRRLLGLENLKLALGEEYSLIQRKKIIYHLFQHLTVSFIEFLRFSEVTAQNLDKFVGFEGLDILNNLYAQKKGVLVLTAHIGNWEFLSGAVSLSGFNTSMIVKSARQKSVNYYIIQQRKAKNIKLFSGKQVIKHILKQLRTGGIVGIVLDQHAKKSEGVLVPFFGRTASTLKSLAILSERTQSPVLPMYVYRDAEDRHHVVIDPVIAHSPEEDIAARTLKYNQWTETAIKKHPEQWIWTHNRWKRED